MEFTEDELHAQHEEARGLIPVAPHQGLAAPVSQGSRDRWGDVDSKLLAVGAWPYSKRLGDQNRVTYGTAVQGRGAHHIANTVG